MQLVQEVGGRSEGKAFSSISLRSSPQLCALHAKEGPARESVKGKKGHKRKDLRQKEGHIHYIRKG